MIRHNYNPLIVNKPRVCSCWPQIAFVGFLSFFLKLAKVTCQINVFYSSYYTKYFPSSNYKEITQFSQI